MNNNKDKIFNLTTPQENIWITEQLNPNSNINNIYGTVLFNQLLDIETLAKSINKVIETNDALRINIKLIDNKPVQYITEYTYDDIPVYLLDDENENRVDSIIDSIRLENMNILNSKLYDIRIIQTSAKTYLCLKTHHIISDAWSTGQLLVEEIKKNYKAIETNQIIDNQPSYIEYINKDIEYKNSPRYEKDKQFWEKYVKNLSCKNEFEIVTNKKSKRIEKSLDEKVATKIADFCEEQHISLYSFFLGIISIYFSKIFNNNNIVFGVPFLNRKKTCHELEMMGMFISTLPLNIELENDYTFLDICKQIVNKNLACFKHSGYPYSEIQKLYQEASEQNLNLYEIAFSFQVNKLEEELNGETGITNWICNQTQQTPLLISFVNHFGERKLCYDYITQLFDDTDIDNIHNRLLVIINQVLKNVNVNLEKISILNEDDLKLLESFNNTGNANLTNETIVSRFEKAINNNKTKTAIKCGDDFITYSELDKKSNSVANALIASGLKKSSPVAIIFDKSIEMFITILGILKAGGYYIPILPEENQERTEYIIKNSCANFIISPEKYSTQICTSENQTKLNIDELMHNTQTDFPNINIKPTDLSCIIYTSGSTGKPKGVMIKHENIISLINSMNNDEDLKFLKDDIAISLLKYSFDASAIDIYSALLNAGTLIVVPKEYELNPEKVFDIIINEKVTRTFTVHKWIEQIQNISQDKHKTLDSLRIIGTGAEVLKPQNFEYILNHNKKLNLYNTYGPTETTMFVTKHKINDNDIQNNISPIGSLIPNTRAVVLNSNNEILPINCKGELTIFEDNNSSKNISSGYLNLEDLTKKKFIKFINPYTKKVVNGYKTGDIVKINNNLELEFFGRQDDFKKINGGYLVSLNEVETKIQTILGNTIKACVITVPIRNVNSLILFIEKSDTSANIKLEDIKNEINNKLTFYMRPKQIIEIDKIPLNKNGKTSKKALESKATEYLDTKTVFIPPSNKTEQMIYAFVKEIIKTDFSITDDFEDDLGIDSLNMTILYSKLSNNKISLQDLYNYPTVKDLAHVIRKEDFENDDISDVNIKIRNASNKTDLENILLTGATGFVGTHLLRELANNENVKKIYCIIRQKLTISSQDRFEKIIHNYFDEDTCKQIKKKAIVLDGDLSKEDLGLSSYNYNKIFKEVKTIINAAANVKHIGKYHSSYIDNVESVNNLIKICTEFNISLAHISTLSLNGYNNTNVKEIFSENTLNIHQTFNRNPYLITKYEAEQNILKNISYNHLNAKIFRIGNIMPRLSDGTFQINFEQNGFLLALNALYNLKLVTPEILNQKVILTPVDECCSAIIKILNSDYCNTIYHIENNKKTKLSSFIDILSNRDLQISTVTMDKFEKTLYKNYSIGTEYLKSILNADTNKCNNDITLEILNKLDFDWKPITKNYLENIINISMKIK